MGMYEYQLNNQNQIIMKHLLGILLALIIQISYASSTQKVTITQKGKTLSECLDEIKKQTGYNIIYINNTLDLKQVIDVDLKNKSLDEALTLVLGNKGVDFTVKNNTIAIYKAENKDAKSAQVTLNVLVKSIDGSPISNASIFIEGNEKALGQTNAEGVFIANVTEATSFILVKHVNYEDQKVRISNRRSVEVVLEEKVTKIEESVITGIYTRDKESFSGSSRTYTAKELKMISNVNVLVALKSLDPAFAIEEDNLMGSDPNVLPDVNVRGKTSVIGIRQQFGTDPNQPLFILDGFESNLRVIFDLPIDRVASITILKDAAATAIYGSKAANGVIVIETVKPKPGQLTLTYSNNTNFSFADLTDYNLMNAEEKLTFERLSGLYGQLDENQVIIDEYQASLYNARLAEVKRGVDSYWMSEPIRKVASNRHNVNVEGGDQRVRYGLGFNYGNNLGVMKGSDRNVIGGNVRLIYRLNRFSFSNNFTIDYSKNSNNIVDFSSFSKMNQYYRKYDENGNILRVVESFTNAFGPNTELYNPMYDFYLKSFNRGNNTEFRNNFEADWRLIDALRIRGRFSFAKGNSRGQIFSSPYANAFINATTENKGRYTESNGHTKSFDFDFTTSYGKALGRDSYHTVNALVGMRANLSQNELGSYAVAGYKDQEYWAPKFSMGYVEGSRPAYSFNDRRSLSYYSNLGYSYRNRYLFDFNYRIDGSSLFGLSNKFTQTWAVGAAWNLHQESFMADLSEYVSMFKIRSSLGNPGNQNFDAYMTMNNYIYNLNYPNPFGLSAIISEWGNPHLQWQKTLDRNFGLDLEILNRKFYMNIDYFLKTTDPLLIYVQVPTSTGTNQIAQNVGAQKTTGLTANLTYRAIVKENLLWNINFNARNLKSTYYDIGNSLNNLNKENTSRNLQRYYDGASTTDLWAVKSLGIDPATGREMFLKKDGTQTFVHDYADEQVLGNSTPTWEGVAGTMLAYKGFSFSANFRYRYGGQIFLNTLFNKVENITLEGLRSNQDRRALYERWQKPGDETQFKGISLTNPTPISSRFIADENTFSCESVSLGYETNGGWTKRFGFQALQSRLYLNEIFRVSTVTNERGINYPFARTVSFSISGRF